MIRFKKLLIFILIFFFQSINAQNQELITSINSRLIKIESSNPEYPLQNQHEFSDIFKDIRIFGFGEATHGTKEFQDLKTKFFKYLVLNHNVKTFAVEANYGDCLAINSYIQDGQSNTKYELSKISYWIWNTGEFSSLIEWMKAYNATQDKENKLSFTGIDVADCYNASNILYRYLQKESLSTNQKHLQLLSIYISKDSLKKNTKKDFEEQYLELQSLNAELKKLEDKYLWRLSNSILQYISLRINYTQTVRDKLMFENINWLVENTNSNVFICAHNIHISKKNISFNTLGYNLKNKYVKKYYSVGFDFASGSFNAFDIEENKIKKYNITEPIKKTSTEVFNSASSDIYLLDFDTNNTPEVFNKFLTSKSFRRGIGSTYSPKMVENEKLIETFDAIIFVKKTHESSLLNY